MNTDNVNRNDTYTPVGVKGIADLDRSRAEQGTCGRMYKKTWVNAEGKRESYRGACTRYKGHTGKHDPLYNKKITPRADFITEGDEPHVHLPRALDKTRCTICGEPRYICRIRSPYVYAPALDNWENVGEPIDRPLGDSGRCSKCGAHGHYATTCQHNEDEARPHDGGSEGFIPGNYDQMDDSTPGAI